MRRKKAHFSISAVAEMFSVHQQTIRLYEKEGLISPKRSDGNTRLFSESDVERLEEIIYLTHKLGINLAGVEMILKLKKQIKKMQQDMNHIFEEANENLDTQIENKKEEAKQSLKQIQKLKLENKENSNKTTATNDLETKFTEDIDSWEIDYEE